MKNIALAMTSTLLFAACGGSSSGPASPAVTPPPAPPPVTPKPVNVNISNPTQTTFDNGEVSQGGALTLVWSDEFSDAQLDPETWFFESGDGSQYGIPGWGNNEQQWYLEDNAALGNGILTLTAKAESQNGYAFTSARLLTRDRVAVRYGRIEASIRLPGGQGLWPAFWMLPQDFVC
jgi:beta-glucanase (GH16 family)